MWIDERTIDLLQRRFALTLDSEGPLFLLECRRLFRWLAADVNVAPYCRDLIEGYLQIDVTERKVLDRAMRRLEQLREAALANFPGLGGTSAETKLRADGPDESRTLKTLDELFELARAALQGEAKGAEVGEVRGLLADCGSQLQEALRRAAQELPPEDARLESTRAICDSLSKFEKRRTRDTALLQSEREMSAGLSALFLLHIAQASALRSTLSNDAPFAEVIDRVEGVSFGTDDDAESVLGDERVLKAHLRRLCVELRALLGSALSHRQLFSRFKARAVWYDKERLRALVLDPSGQILPQMENRLVRELARYLFDQGVWAILKVPFANHEVDLLGPLGRPLLVEGKVHKDDARGKIVDGIAQLHAYMTTLEGTPLHVTEAHYVVFRVGGPLYELPEVIRTNRFRICTHTVDLGEAVDSGRNQPKPHVIKIEELIASIDAVNAASLSQDQAP